MAESAGLAQSVDFSSKQVRASGKNSKVKPSMKRSQSEFNTKELTKNGFPSTLSVTLILRPVKMFRIPLY